MPDDAVARAHAVFTRALALDGDSREEWIRTQCADDPEVLKRVRRLLKATDRSSDFLESPAMASRAGVNIPIPDAVGNYLIVGVLGVGGMATVYEAEQENPSRRVAIKVMHQSMSRTDALLRFRLEAQTLARLRHPGIAQIYEAGTAPLGQPTPSPFFAMELIPEALTITAYANQKSLTLRERLAMFVTVCEAVLHGHQNGIIHRDIKPANVLVGQDGRAKVIDFGIARAIDPGESSLTGAADQRRLIGTLTSMSPEQCTNPEGIDARSDVYSLGVLLYELVTGKLPHDVTRCSIPQAVRLITEGEVPRASLSRPEAKGDLDAIVAMAMEKDRERRYAGAGELAADVRRYLNNQPVLARRSGAFEQVRKFAKRNPPLAAAIGVAITLLLLGAVVSTGFAFAAAKARDAALKRERELEIVTEFQESLLRGLDVTAMGERLRASILAKLKALESAKSGGAASAPSRTPEDWDDAFGRVNFTTVAVDALNQSILQRYSKSIRERFDGQPELRARLLQQLATTMNSLGLYAEALPIITEALNLRREILGDDHPDTLQSRHAVGSLLSTLGKYSEAEEQLRRTYELRRKILGTDAVATLSTGTSLGGLYRRMNKLPEAESVWSDTLARQRRVLGDDDPATLRSLNNMGVLYAVQGNPAKAESCWRELLERRRRVVGADHPDYRSSLGNLGTLLQDQGRFEEAAPLLREALEADRSRFGDAHATTLTSMAMLASLLRESGNPDAAETLARECLAGRITTLGADHPDTLGSMALLGAILHARGNAPEGERLLREALEAQNRLLGESHGASLESLAFLRDIALSGGRPEQAMELSSRLTRLAREGKPPLSLGPALSAHGAVLLASGRDSEALPALTEGYEECVRAFGQSHPQTRAAAARLAAYYAKAHDREPAAGHEATRAKWSQLAESPQK